MWYGKVSGKKERVTEVTCNALIESFSRLELQIIRNGISWFESKESSQNNYVQVSSGCLDFQDHNHQ